MGEIRELLETQLTPQDMVEVLLLGRYWASEALWSFCGLPVPYPNNPDLYAALREYSLEEFGIKVGEEARRWAIGGAGINPCAIQLIGVVYQGVPRVLVAVWIPQVPQAVRCILWACDLANLFTPY